MQPQAVLLGHGLLPDQAPMGGCGDTVAQPLNAMGRLFIIALFCISLLFGLFFTSFSGGPSGIGRQSNLMYDFVKVKPKQFDWRPWPVAGKLRSPKQYNCMVNGSTCLANRIGLASTAVNVQDLWFQYTVQDVWSPYTDICLVGMYSLPAMLIETKGVFIDKFNILLLLLY
eukprot:jgi/Botrbrau1/18358/Bobra.0179s0083.1